MVEPPKTPKTIADGLRGTRPGDLPFEIVRRMVDGVLTVGDGTVREAVRRFHRFGKIAVEPSGAVVADAIIEGKVPPPKGPICAVLSGGLLDAGIKVIEFGSASGIGSKAENVTDKDYLGAAAPYLDRGEIGMFCRPGFMGRTSMI